MILNVMESRNIIKKCERCFHRAEYEANHDPYRGIINHVAQNPWDECKIRKNADDFRPLSCITSCPSLLEWKRESDRMNGKKKRSKTLQEDVTIFGKRRENATSQCKCDENPFCLVSLGGVMDDFLRQVETNHPPSNGSSSEGNVTTTDHVDLHGKKIKDNGNFKVKIISSIDSIRPTKDTNRIPVLTNLTLNDLTPTDEFFRKVELKPKEIDPSNDEFCIYKDLTREQLSTLRKYAFIAKNQVHNYFEELVALIPSTRESDTILQYISKLESVHEEMIFKNPLKHISLSSEMRQMRIALPPGIKNLGATCYLNTQLQCLARNIAFLEGIFAWQPSQLTGRMDSVLSKLQKVLADLSFGAESTITTEEFSRALGLQNDEMQDPNEFAKLLFQRIQEAFQHCSKFEKNGSSSLNELLPSLFQGAMTNETRCLTCKRVSSRKEYFMDINLPLVRASNDKACSGQQRIEEAFSKDQSNGDHTVQHFWDRYMCAEKLTGENQYWCENCMQKRDATRQVVLNKIPPVLNLQLCRYIFDRQKQTKKKLTEKVLLSQVLNVKCKSDPTTTSYRLCAVMKHIGKSAYRGHYVAEAMDWQTGEWFEFDDESVSLLKDGPNSSSCRSQKKKREECSSGKRKEKKGSEDAYNMYYVSEAFLGRKVVRSFDRSLHDWRVTKQVKSERSAKFKVLEELCREDAKLAIRRKRRRRGLLALLNSCFPSQIPHLDLEYENATKLDSIWVDGATLRAVFACNTDQSIDFMLNKLVEIESYYCVHKKGIHPRVARKGKILPKRLFSGIIKLLEGEKKYLEREQSCKPVASQSRTQFSQGILASKINCFECSTSYKSHIRAKLKLFRSLTTLNDELNPKNEITACEEIDSGHVYALSRRFVTQFRNVISAAEKKIDDNYFDGLDKAELPCFLKIESGSTGKFPLDVYVNSAIVCENHKCCIVNKRTVRYVPERLWTSILTFFPKAITLKKAKGLEYKWNRCQLCEEQYKLAVALRNWANMVTLKLPEKTLQKRVRQEPLRSEDIVLIHSQEIKKLWNIVKLISSKRQVDICKLKSMLLGNSSEHVKCKNIKNIFEMIIKEWQPISLLCADHNLAMNPLVFKRKTMEGSDVYCNSWEYTNFVILLYAEEYKDYTNAILELYQIVFLDKTITKSEEEIEAVSKFIEKDLTSKFHAKIKMGLPNDKKQKDIGENFSSLKVSVKNITKEIMIIPAMCASQYCNKICVEKMIEEKKSKSKRSSEYEVDTRVNDDEVQVIAKSDMIDAAEMKEKDVLRIRLLDIKQDVDLENIAALLNSNVSNANKNIDGLCGPRRSTRKRKERYCYGPILGEEIMSIQKSQNLAALRLHILERKPDFKLDQTLFLCLLLECPVLRKDISKNIIVELLFDWNEKIVSNVIDEAISNLSVSKARHFEIYDSCNLCIFRPIANVHQQRKKSRKSKYDDLPNEVLFDSLLQIANFQATSKISTVKKKKKNIEKGFIGTLLHASNKKPSRDTSESIVEVSNSAGITHEKSEYIMIDDTSDSNKSIKQEKDYEGPKHVTKYNDMHTSRREIVLNELLNVVKSIEAGRPNEEICRFVAGWACDENKGDAKTSDLTDLAYAKYLEMCIL